MRSAPLAAAAALLKSIAARIDLGLVKKHKRGPEKPVPKRTRFKNEPHISTLKMLDGTAEEKPKKSPSKTRRKGCDGTPVERSQSASHTPEESRDVEPLVQHQR